MRDIHKDRVSFLFDRSVNAAEIRYHDTACGTHFCTVTAVRTFIVVDNGEVVYNLDSTGWAFPFTFFTRNTAVGTFFARNGAFFRIAARNEYFFDIRHY